MIKSLIIRMFWSLGEVGVGKSGTIFTEHYIWSDDDVIPLVLGQCPYWEQQGFHTYYDNCLRLILILRKILKIVPQLESFICTSRHNEIKLPSDKSNYILVFFLNYICACLIFFRNDRPHNISYYLTHYIVITSILFYIKFVSTRPVNLSILQRDSHSSGMIPQ